MSPIVCRGAAGRVYTRAALVAAGGRVDAGFGPGFIFVLWGPVVAVLLLVGRWRSRNSRAG